MLIIMQKRKNANVYIIESHFENIVFHITLWFLYNYQQDLLPYIYEDNLKEHIYLKMVLARFK